MLVPTTTDTPRRGRGVWVSIQVSLTWYERNELSRVELVSYGMNEVSQTHMVCQKWEPKRRVPQGMPEGVLGRMTRVVCVSAN